MKKISIFNEKGGSGKTTVTLMLASYLAYSRGKRICVLDFDAPSYHLCEIRSSELALLDDPRSQLSIWMKNHPGGPEPYGIMKAAPSDGDRPGVDDVLSIIETVSRGPYDYILYDFPGHFTEDDPAAYLPANGFIDFIAIPMDTDRQSRLSAYIVASALKGCGVRPCLFWNRVTSQEEKGGKRFAVGAEPFRRLGLDVMEEKVRDLKMFSRDSSELAFIRSTICFPERYIRMRCPSVIPFLEALSGRIDSI